MYELEELEKDAYIRSIPDVHYNSIDQLIKEISILMDTGKNKMYATFEFDHSINRVKMTPILGALVISKRLSYCLGFGGTIRLDDRTPIASHPPNLSVI